MTLNRIIYNILNQLQGGPLNQSGAYSKELVIEWVLQYRALFARRDHDRGGSMREFEQTITVPVEVHIVSGQTNGKTTATYRSGFVPIPVRLKASDGITHVCSEGGGEEFPIVSSESARWMPYNRFTNNDKRAYYSDNRIFVVTDRFINTLFENEIEGLLLSTIDVTGVFEDPRQVHFLNNSNTLYTGDEPFPIPADIAIQLINVIVEKEGKQMLEVPNDDSLDGKQTKP